MIFFSLQTADDLRREIDSNGKLAYNSDTFLNPPPPVLSHNSVANSVANSPSNHQINGSISVKSNNRIINNPPPNYSNSNHTAPNVPFIHNSRVFNLKPEKPSMPRANGIMLSNQMLARKDRQRMGNKNYLTNGNNSTAIKVNNASNFNNFLPQPSTSSYLTFNITRNGLQTSRKFRFFPLCSSRSSLFS